VEPEAWEILLHLHGRRRGHHCHRSVLVRRSALVSLLLGRSAALLCLLAALEHDREEGVVVFRGLARLYRLTSVGSSHAVSRRPAVTVSYNSTEKDKYFLFPHLGPRPGGSTTIKISVYFADRFFLFHLECVFGLRRLVKSHILTLLYTSKKEITIWLCLNNNGSECPTSNT
jgi:hypothetical protein